MPTSCYLMDTTMDLAERVLKGDRAAAARLISLIENEDEDAEPLLQRINPHTGRAHVIGVTGSPGSGKSTLVGAMARELRARGKSVGIIAVDPTSPYSGGAVLGDRIRMQKLTGDPGVFIRSMASRGALGGLARATADAVKVLDAFGSQVILVETVGAGQGEVEIARAAHSTVVVEVPGMGDEVQVIKAGILEIADLFVVNKSDRVRADRAVSELRMLLEMKEGHDGWVPPIVKTVATTGSGIVELADVLEAHLGYLTDTGEMERRRQDNALRELVEAAKQQFVGELWAELDPQELSAVMKAILERRVTTRLAAKRLVSSFRRGG